MNIDNLQAVIAANRGTDQASQATAAAAAEAVAAIYSRAVPVLVVSGTPEELAGLQRTTQFCAEAVAKDAEVARLVAALAAVQAERVSMSWHKQASGYLLAADFIFWRVNIARIFASDALSQWWFFRTITMAEEDLPKRHDADSPEAARLAIIAALPPEWRPLVPELPTEGP